MAFVEEEGNLEVSELLPRQEEVSGSTRRTALRFAAALTACGCVAAFGTRHMLQGKPGGSPVEADVGAAVVWEAVGSCTVKKIAPEQWCTDAKPIGEEMRKSGQNSPEVCARTAAADVECGAWINYDPLWQNIGACHCVKVGSANSQCTARGAMQGFSIFTGACTGVPLGGTAGAGPPHHVAPPVPHVEHPTSPHHEHLPPLKLTPELEQAGRCLNPHMAVEHEGTSCHSVKLLGPQMRSRENSLKMCAQVAAVDPGCGAYINYNPDWEGQGACHCVDKSNLDCNNHDMVDGFKVYKLSCPALTR